MWLAQVLFDFTLLLFERLHILQSTLNSYKSEELVVWHSSFESSGTMEGDKVATVTIKTTAIRRGKRNKQLKCFVCSNSTEL